jgi:hypothetical protein
MLQTEDELDQDMRNEYGSPCISDGITNIEKFYNAKYQILWILKEPNDDSGKEWCMRDFHKNVIEYNKWKQTYQPIVQVSHGILNGIYDYADIPSSDEIVIDAMNSIAFINVKKIGGRASSDWNVINQNYIEHKEFLHKQIKTISPNVIINCSGINQLFRDLAGIDGNENVDSFHHRFINEQLIINAYHPNQKTITQRKYFDLIAEIKKPF